MGPQYQQVGTRKDGSEGALGDSQTEPKSLE
jgi:hypothetical protein